MSLTTRVQEAIELCDSVVCLGLDPAKAKTAEEARETSITLLEQAGEFVSAVKPNIAFFERFGSEGLAALEEVIRHIPKDRLLILDAKRGDIGTTAQAYAASAFDHFDADAVTVNPLMGRDAVEPFLNHADRGPFILTRTSNRSADDFLRQKLVGGARLYERIVEEAMTWDGTGSIGFVVGATDVRAVETVRHHATEAPLLLPGVGPQGGKMEAALLAALDARGAGCFIAVSRGIADAKSPADEAKRLRDLCNDIRRVNRTAKVS